MTLSVKLKEVIDHIIMAKKINHTFVPFIEFFFFPLFESCQAMLIELILICIHVK